MIVPVQSSSSSHQIPEQVGKELIWVMPCSTTLAEERLLADEWPLADERPLADEWPLAEVGIGRMT